MEVYVYLFSKLLKCFEASIMCTIKFHLKFSVLCDYVLSHKRNIKNTLKWIF